MSDGEASTVASGVPRFAVDRPSLLDRLDRAMRRRVVLVVAPAGYGKSVLLRQWREARADRPVMWIAAQASDTAPIFGGRLARALEAVVPGAAERASRVLGLDASALGEDALRALGADLVAGGPVVVVIEDMELLTGLDLRREVVGLAERLPVGSSFVLVSRDDRFPGLEALRLRDEVAEIRQADLALSRDEVTDVVQRMGGPVLSPSAADALWSRTEGWAAGVQLAALGLRDHEDPGGFVADFAGDDRHVADYLSGEVLARQTPAVTEFLLRTAVLDRLSGSLCDAVTGAADGQRMLEWLDGQSMFLRPLDGRRGWFAYHPLFRDLIRHELRASHPGEEEALLQRAAAWHLDRGESAPAAEYLLRAGDWSAVIALADVATPAYFERGEPVTIVRWLEAIPRARMDDDPDAQLALALLLTMCGRTFAAQEVVDRLEHSHPLALHQDAEVASIRATWTSYHAPPEGVDEPLATITALRDDELERPGGPLLGMWTPALIRSLTIGSAGIVRSMQGEYDSARELLAGLERVAAGPVWLIHALGERAWLDAATGELGRAVSQARRALRMAEASELDHHPSTAMAHLALARAGRERGEPAAVDHVDAGLVRGRLNDRHRVLAVAWGERAAAALADRREVDGLAVIDQAAVHGGPPLPPVERARLAALEARLHLLAGDPGSASRALDRHTGLVTSEVAAASAAVAAASDDLPRLGKVLDDWPVVDAPEPAARRAHGLWSAVLADLEGDRAKALATLHDVVADAERDQAVRPFLDGGHEVQRLVRALHRRRPTAFLRRLVADVVPTGRLRSDELVEQLTERERGVLAYLPTRMSNAEIADVLYVSVNTLKTHLKSIYRKLAVRDRGQAIERAEELGLL